jgi:hypothetical protein
MAETLSPAHAPGFFCFPRGAKPSAEMGSSLENRHPLLVVQKTILARVIQLKKMPSVFGVLF